MLSALYSTTTESVDPAFALRGFQASPSGLCRTRTAGTREGWTIRLIGPIGPIGVRFTGVQRAPAAKDGARSDCAHMPCAGSLAFPLSGKPCNML